MQLFGTYYDGLTADPRAVSCTIQGTEASGFLEVTDLELDHMVAHWPQDSLLPVPGRKGELRLASSRAPAGARIVFADRETAARARRELPVLARHRKRHTGRQFRVIGLSTMAMASVVLAYIYGIPLLAGQIVGLIPPDMETRFGDKVVIQMASALEDTGGLRQCDPDPESLANQAIGRFTRAALEGTDAPFDVSVQVVANKIPNAFALPGGRAFYFQGLLDKTESADEFAGVMAHEIGHVVHRDGMQQLIATAGTGLLVGFVLGDITGLSVAGTVGAALINTSFSRDAERQADRFALEVAKRRAFQPTGLADLLERVSKDDASAQIFALLSTHPLTQERRAALEGISPMAVATVPAFSQEEWQAIKAMCLGSGAGKSKNKNKAIRGD
ncbi:MAG TPA: M48 family metallopeptidase [Devosia sp.]|nr:M48 family metallopeptidase [Devosia sp.]